MRLYWLLLLIPLTGCLNDSTGPGDRDVELADAELRVAFVGNSLTYVQDIPGLVQSMADADGRSMSHVTITSPNLSLEEHWALGTPDVLRDLEPDIVVMQQGPSSLQENQFHLSTWAGKMNEVIQEFGGRSALYMVWPADSFRESFPAVWTSYRTAAVRTDGLFIPAGQTWVEAWNVDPELPLYGSDGFHPSRLGALAAAETIYAVLFDLEADAVPTLDIGADQETLDAVRAGLAASLAMARSDTTAVPGAAGR